MSHPDPLPAPVTARSLVRAALPLGAFYLTEVLVGLTDLAVVGSLGTAELAGVGLGKMILLSIMVVGFAVLSVGTVFMAERPTPRCRGAIVAASLVTALPFGVVAVAIGYRAEDLLDAAGYAPDVVRAFAEYARVLAWAIVPAMLLAALKNVLVAVGRTGAIAWLSVGIVALNLAGGILLVHGIVAWNGLGVAGAGWATILANAAAAVALLVHVRRFVRIDGLQLSRVFGGAVGIVRLGWAAGAQQALESVLFIVVLALLGAHSPLWLAAGTLVFAVMELNYVASVALGEVLAARIASARAGRTGEAFRLLRLGVGISGGTAAILAMMLALFTEPVAGIFSGSQASPAARHLTVDLLRWTAPVFLFDAWQVVLVHALRGLRRTRLPMVLSTGCYWIVGLGSGVALAGPVGLDAQGIWIGFCAGLACASAMLAIVAVRCARSADRGA